MGAQDRGIERVATTMDAETTAHRAEQLLDEQKNAGAGPPRRGQSP
jgi:hypothetical protein